MKRHLLLPGVAGALALLASVSAQADRKLSPELLDQYDRKGYFTPNFKAALYDYVDAREALDKAQVEQAKFEKDLPALEQQSAVAQAKTAALRQELARFDHPEEIDFTALQAKAKEAAAPAGEVIALAQAYVWTYPDCAHEAEAQQILSRWQARLAADQQAQKEAEAARAAAHAELVRRALARDLSLPEWRDFLRGMSQVDLVKLLGQPSSTQDDYWFYEGGWIVNPANPQKAALQINFEAGRVISVDAKPPSP